MKFYLLVLSLSLVILSCDNKKEGLDLDYVADSIEDLVIPMKNCYKNIIVLPGTGCTGCISVGEEFLAENYKNKEYLFVLTKINSLKELSLKTKIDVTKYSNIYIDDANVFLKKNRLIYPIVIFYDCKKKHVNKIRIQKPGNDAFKEL